LKAIPSKHYQYFLWDCR